MKVGFISLGCNKNLVDTEKTISIFKENNYEIVINTCGFIQPAKEEAINTILEMAEYKKQGCRYLIVMGCLVERYKQELEKEIPEVDLFIKYSEYKTLWSKVQELIKKREENVNFEEWQDRVITTGETTAYLKIADGCSNRCTYCAIPYIRGPLKSRKFEEIIEEAKKLAKRGYKEIILTAQDTTKYGTDIYGKSRLAELLTEISKIKEIKWIRFLYSYPETIDDELIKVVKENEKVCKYFDIPIQHISNNVLKRMNRKSNGEGIRKLIEKLRKEIPEVIIRTTVMVGFPGETTEDFDELYEFIQETKFDKMGAFSYSKEENTPAEKLKEQIHPATKKSRYNKIMQLQKELIEQKLKKYIGKKLEVLIENKTFDSKYYVARSYMEAPETDEVIYIKNTQELEIGQFTNCEITDVKEYDLIGKI
mgnify:FL=1